MKLIVLISIFLWTVASASVSSFHRHLEANDACIAFCQNIYPNCGNGNIMNSKCNRGWCLSICESLQIYDTKAECREFCTLAVGEFCSPGDPSISKFCHGPKNNIGDCIMEACPPPGEVVSQNPGPPPKNDNCRGAFPVIVDGDAVKGKTVRARKENFVEDTCEFFPTPITAPGVWYTVTGTDDWLEATTCSADTTYDTKISVYSGSCNDLACVGGNDDSRCVGGNTDSFGLNSTVFWQSESGVPYYILVHGFSFAVGGFGLSVSTTELVNECIEDNGGCDENAECFDWDLFYPDSIQCTCNSGYIGDGFECTYYEPVDECIEDNGGCDENAVCLDWDISYPGSIQCTCNQDSGYFGDGFECTYYDPPNNDSCDSAGSVIVDGPVVQGTTYAASATGIDQCVFEEPFESPSVWYTVEGTGDLLSATLCHPQTNYDTAMSVFSGTCEALTCLDGNDDSIGELCSTVSWQSEVDTTYTILVYGFFGSAGNFGLSVFTPPACGGCDVPTSDIAGCGGPQCEAVVCATDAYCCDFEWDEYCAYLATQYCDCA